MCLEEFIVVRGDYISSPLKFVKKNVLVGFPLMRHLFWSSSYFNQYDLGSGSTIVFALWDPFGFKSDRSELYQGILLQ